MGRGGTRPYRAPAQLKMLVNSSSLSAIAGPSAWVGGLETAKTRCSLNSQPSTLNQSGELAAHFAREQRRVIGRPISSFILHPSSFILSLRPPAGKSRESVRAPTASTRRREPAAHDVRMLL